MLSERNNAMSQPYSAHKVKAYFGESNREDREDIRNDLLYERYSDILDEKEHLEGLLDISSDDNNVDLVFDINETLFNLLEYIAPEIFSEEDQLNKPSKPVLNKLPKPNQNDGGDNRENEKKERATKIKDREKKVMSLAKNSEKLVRAKSNVKTARLSVKTSKDPKSKQKAAQTLRTAQKNLSKAGVRAGTSKEK
jgi:hypothetical protein